MDAASFLDRFLDARFDYLQATRRHLHAHPEASGEEYQTTLFVLERLREAGLEAGVLASGRGLTVEVGASDASRRIALRADIDALRLQDLKQVQYSSQSPHVMHACGHDGHTTGVLGAILALHAAWQERVLPENFACRAIFQPAEETAVGAMEMIEAGALEGIDAILAAHLDPSRAVGRVGVRYGVLTAACDDVEFSIVGSGGHAARPHESRDPIFAAAQLINALYSFLPRATDSNDSVVLTIGQLIAGDNANVIPEEAILRGTLRTLLDTSRDATRVLIKRLAQGVADLSDTQIEVRFSDGPPSTRNDHHLTQTLQHAATQLLGKENVDVIQAPSMGGEDFSFYTRYVPGAMFRLGCASDESNCFPLHSPYFDIDERALLVGAKTLARAAVLWTQESA